MAMMPIDVPRALQVMQDHQEWFTEAARREVAAKVQDEAWLASFGEAG